MSEDVVRVRIDWRFDDLFRLCFLGWPAAVLAATAWGCLLAALVTVAAFAWTLLLGVVAGVLAMLAAVL